MVTTISLPAMLMVPPPSMAEEDRRRISEGKSVLRDSSVCFVGLARNCEMQLSRNLSLLTELAEQCCDWSLHVETNDNTDGTANVLDAFCQKHRQASFSERFLNRPQFSAEFAGPRTLALAEYRADCQAWVRSRAQDAEYVIVIDFDCGAGWRNDGVAVAISWLNEMDNAFGMASVSLFQHDFGSGPTWAHYDLWALRGVGQRRCWYDTYRNGYGAFGYSWLPPVGSPPVLCSSAFGGMAVYRTADYLRGQYEGSDCEHVPFHRSIAEATGKSMYVCPSMRTLMSWMEQSDGGQHSND